jgi:hypothetical protein
MKAFIEVERKNGKIAVVVVEGVTAIEAEDLALILFSMDPENQMFKNVRVGARGEAHQVYQITAMGITPHDLHQLYQTALRIEGTLRLPELYAHYTASGRRIHVTVP